MSLLSCLSSVLSIDSEALSVQPESFEPTRSMNINQSNSNIELLEKQLAIEK